MPFRPPANARARHAHTPCRQRTQGSAAGGHGAAPRANPRLTLGGPRRTRARPSPPAFGGYGNVPPRREASAKISLGSPAGSQYERRGALAPQSSRPSALARSAGHRGVWRRGLSLVDHWWKYNERTVPGVYPNTHTHTHKFWRGDEAFPVSLDPHRLLLSTPLHCQPALWPKNYPLSRYCKSGAGLDQPIVYSCCCSRRTYKVWSKQILRMSLASGGWGYVFRLLLS